MASWMFDGFWSFWTSSIKRERAELYVKCFTQFLSVKHFTSGRFKVLKLIENILQVTNHFITKQIL